jgi:hypothetical protein
MLDALEKIERFTAKMTFEQFSRDGRTQFAVVRAFEILGEVSKLVSAEVQARYPSVPWSDMAKMRDKAAAAARTSTEMSAQAAPRTEPAPRPPMLIGTTTATPVSSDAEARTPGAAVAQIPMSPSISSTASTAPLAPQASQAACAAISWPRSNGWSAVSTNEERCQTSLRDRSGAAYGTRIDPSAATRSR